MVIGIVGAGLSGLIAGRILAKAGHEVTIFEKSRGYRGRMATRYAGKELASKMDHGLSYFGVKSDEFRKFTAELLDQDLIQTWGDKFAAYDGKKFLDTAPNQTNEALFTSTGGMNKIGKYLSRWVDIHTEMKVGGLTYFGTNRSKKRSWMVNLTSSNTFEADAVIIALPAPQAYGIISSTIDETNTLKIVRQIDEVTYKPAFSLMAGYGNEEAPNWQGVICRNSPLEFISNEKSKRDAQETSFVLHASQDFTKAHKTGEKENISKEMLGAFAEISGGWAASPQWQQLHFWRYSRAQQVINEPFLELEDEDAPLALIGDYLRGNTVDDAYRSGYLLANHWVNKY